MMVLQFTFKALNLNLCFSERFFIALGTARNLSNNSVYFLLSFSHEIGVKR